MKIKNVSGLFLLGFAITGMFLSGCTPKQKNLITSKGVSIEAVYSERVHISDLAVSEDGNELVITGKVHRRNQSISGSGHVDVTILDSAGNVIKRGDVPYTPTTLPKTPGARKHRGARFEVRLSCVLPAGSNVRVAYHATIKPGGEGPDCERSVSAGAPVRT
jgi:hypothetical protein